LVPTRTATAPLVPAGTERSAGGSNTLPAQTIVRTTESATPDAAARDLPPTGVDLNGVQVWMAALGAVMLVLLLALTDRRARRRSI
jgi:hypothetical protein